MICPEPKKTGQKIKMTGLGFLHPPDPARPLPKSRRWFAICTYPTKEAQAAWWLEGAGHHALVPLETRWKLARGAKRAGKTARRVRYQVPLLPRIVLCGMTGFPDWLKILAFPGISGVIGTNGEPIPLRPGEAERIQASSEAVRHAPQGREHKVGQMVRVVIPIPEISNRVVQIEGFDGTVARLTGLFPWASKVTVATDDLESAA
jgi:transcription antitermination factor NusG